MFEQGLLNDRVAVITGGGTGIGLAIAKRLGALGARIAIASRNSQHLEAGCAALCAAGVDALAVQLDVRKPEQVDEMVERTVKHFGGFDILINNAAGNFVVKGEDLSPNGWRAVVSIVLDGGFLCARAAGRRMIAQGSGGAVLSVIASYAWTGGPGTVHSASAKAGLLAMTKTLAVEWAPHRIRLNTICPGPTDTEGAGQALWPDAADRARVERSVPAGRLATVEEIAWWSTALCSDFGSYVTGMNFTIDGGHWLEQDSYMPSLKPRD